MTPNRSVNDWVERLRDAPLELPEAMKVPDSAHEWRTLLRGVAGWAPIAERDVIIERTLEFAARESDVRGFREVAEFFPHRARGALRAGVDAFRRSAAAPAYQWVILGEGFLQTLHDLDGLRECLEAGLSVARAGKDLSGLCRVAEQWGLRLEMQAAKALLDEAEALVTPGEVWALSHAYRALGDAQAEQRVLADAQTKATTFRDALRVAQAWARPDQPQAVAALTHAESFARTAGEWLEVAAFTASTDASAARRAIEHAEKLIDSDSDPEQTRSRVSRAYVQLLDDEAASARVGPRGVRPEAMREPRAGSAPWPTSASGLFDWFRGKVTDDNLTHIAGADPFDAPAHFAALKDICESGLVPRVLDWAPHEALALTRWSSGAHTDHLDRGLSALLLCLAPDSFDEFATNGVILLDSCVALGGEALELAGPFFAWHAQSVEDDESIASLLLLMAQAARDPSDPRLSVLATRLDENTDSTLEDVATRISAAMRSELWFELLERLLGPMADDAVRHLVKRMKP